MLLFLMKKSRISRRRGSFENRLKLVAIVVVVVPAGNEVVDISCSDWGGNS
jgi:hypothetical protein